MTNTHNDKAADRALRVIEKSTREELEMLLEMPDEIFHEFLGELRKDEVRRLREVALGNGIEPQRVCAIHRGG
jgi:hypothetical protein